MSSFMIYHDWVNETLSHFPISKTTSIHLLRALRGDTVIFFPNKMQCRDANHSGVHRFLELKQYNDCT